MAERIDDHPGALAVEGVAGGALERGAGGDGALDRGVGIVHVQVQGGAVAVRRVGLADAQLREFLAQHQDGAVEVHLGVADASARFDQAEFLRGAEGMPVEVDRARGVGDAEVGEQFVGSHGCLAGGRGPAGRMARRRPPDIGKN